MNSVAYMGHTCFKLRLGNDTVLINPAIGGMVGGRPRTEKSALDVHSVRECDFIFLTNEEDGNLEPASVKEIAERCFSKVVAPRPALSQIDVSDRLKVEVRVGDRFTLKGIEVEVVKAVHPQSAYPVGYVFRGGGISVYHSGDTYSFTDMARIKCDVALVPIGGGSVMDPFAANSIVKEMRPKVAVPMHYNTTDRMAQDPQEFITDLGGITRGIALRVGQELRI